MPLISYYVFLQAEEPDRTKQQRMMFGNPYRQEKNDGGADEGWSEGTGGLLQRGRKRRRRIQQQGDSSSVSTSLSCSNLSCLAESSTDVSLNTEAMSSQRLQKGQDNLHPSLLVVKPCQSVPPSVLKEGDLIMNLSEPDIAADKCNLVRGIDNVVTDEEDRISVTDNLDPGNCGVPENEIEIPGQWKRKRHVVPVRPLVSHFDQSHVVKILLSVIRALRYSKSLKTKQVSITFFLQRCKVSKSLNSLATLCM